jgi:hypothetical protein
LGPLLFDSLRRFGAISASIQICPVDGDKTPGSIGQHQDQLKAPVATEVTHDLECLALERVPSSGDCYRRREVLDVGSVS